MTEITRDQIAYVKELTPYRIGATLEEVMTPRKKSDDPLVDMLEEVPAPKRYVIVGFENENGAVYARLEELDGRKQTPQSIRALVKGFRIVE